MLLFYFLKNANLKTLDTGSAQSQITIANLSKLKLIVPMEYVLNRYHEFTKTLRVKKKNNENKYLINLKELLLQKLMSCDITF